MTIAQVLARAAKLVERGWCQGWTAKTNTGEEVSVTSPHAKLFCPVGAIALASNAGETGNALENQARNWFARFVGTTWIGKWNDMPSRTAPEVATWLSSAAE